MTACSTFWPDATVTIAVIAFFALIGWLMLR